jgi:hypothetical protein
MELVLIIDRPVRFGSEFHAWGGKGIRGFMFVVYLAGRSYIEGRETRRTNE